MSTATKLRQKEQTSSWSAIFPTEQVTQQQSTLFVKKLLAVAISNITYLRAIFPENAFGDRCLEDLNLKILRDDSACPGSCQVIKWVKGCFDALERQYLRMIVIGIYVDVNDPETVIESYTFKFSYQNNGGIDIFRNKEKIASAYSSSETKKATIRLLRTIVVLTQSLQSLPDEVMMTMRLLYYDDVTPSEYEPPGFASASSENFKFDEEPMNIKIGDIDTPFHSVKLRIKTDAKQFQMVDGEENVAVEGKDDDEEENGMEMQEEEQTIRDNGLDREEEETEDQDMQTQAEKTYEFTEDDPGQMVSPMVARLCHRKKGRGGVQEVPEPNLGDDAPCDTPNKPNSAVYQPTPGSQVSINEEFGVRCPCGCNEDDGLMILCSVCNHWQHGVCFTVLHEDDAPQRHVCDMCAMPNDADLAPTDPTLSGLTEMAIQESCLWRRTLVACKETNRLLAPGLAKRLGCEVNVAKGIYTRLENEGIVKASRGKKLGKSVDRDALEDNIKKYFSKTSQEAVSENSKEKQPQESKGKSKETTEDAEIEKLAKQADAINLSGRHSKSGRGKQAKTPGKKFAPARTRGQKRAKSVADEEEYEISCSQDVQHSESEQVQKRRKKASLAERAIMV